MAVPASGRFLLATLVVAGVAAPLGPGLLQGAAYAAVALAAGAAAVVAALRSPPGGRLPWLLLAAGQALNAAAEAVRGLVASGGAVAFPAPSDALYLAAYVPLLAAVAVLVRRSSAPSGRTAFVDAGILTTGIVAVAWTFFLAPSLREHGDPLQLGAWIAFSVAQVLGVSVAIRLAFAPCASVRACRLLLGFLVLQIASTLAYGVLELAGLSPDRFGVPAGWVASYALLGAAALHPSAAQLRRARDVRSEHVLPRFRLLGLALALVTAPLVIGAQALRGEPLELRATLGASIVLGLLVLVRLAGVVAAHGRLATERAELAVEVQRRAGEARFRSLVQNAADVIVVVDDDGRVRFATPSVERLLGVAATEVVGRSIAAALHPDDLERAREFLRVAERRDGVTGPEELVIARADGGVRIVEVVANNLLHDQTVEGLVITARDVTDRKTLERQLAHQAHHDPLTGLANRTLFAERVERAIADGGGDAGVLFLDLDDFKTVNDSLGHGAGDSVLVAVAERLRGCVRDGDTCARLGGDEFAILLRAADDAVAAEIAERVLAALEQPVALRDRDVFVAASIGIAFAAGAGSADELLRNADVAMYRAKNDGGGGYRSFEPQLHEAAVERLRLRGELQTALDGDEFRLAYQPIVDLATDRVVAFEALLRWHHPQRGAVPPRDFIPLAEETGLILPLGSRVVRDACMQARAWHDRHPADPPLAIAVNVSARQLQDRGFVGEVRGALADSGIDPPALVLELTESLLLAENEAAAERLQALKGLGVRLAIDDFGTGYSSLAYLQRLPIDILKIARPFVARLGRQDAGDRLTEAILGIARSLDLETIAEGVEDREQQARLRVLACAMAQGDYLGAPLEAHAAGALLDLQSVRRAA